MVKTAHITAAVISLLTCPYVLAESLYPRSSAVLQVDGRSYDKLIARSNHTSIVEFYAPWCGHCKNLQPAYEKAAKSLSGLANVAAVNCDEDSNKQFCGSMQVQGFPTLKIVRPGKKPGKPIIEDYQGPRNAKGIVDAVVDKIPSHVKRLKDADYMTWIGETDAPCAILFTEKGTVSALFKSMAIDFLGSIQFAQIRDKEKKAVETLRIEKFPTLVLLPGGDQDPMRYIGAMKREPMMAFLSQAASPNPDPAVSFRKSTASSSGKSKPAKKSAAVPKSKAGEDEAVSKETPNTPRATEPVTPIVSLQDGLSLQQKCLNNKAGTCILALLPDEDTPSLETIHAIRSVSEVQHKYRVSKRNLFPFFQLPASNSQATALRNAFKLRAGQVEVIALNGKRAWWRSHTGGLGLQEVESWIDAIRMGELPKQDVPNGIIVDAAELPSQPVSADGESPDIAAMRESLKDSLPEGMELEIEEVSDEDYEQLLKQGAKDGQQGSPEGHDEL